MTKIKSSIFVLCSICLMVSVQSWSNDAGLSPAYYEGPLVGTQDKTIKLEFMRPRVSDQGELLVLLKFKADKMIINNAAVY